MRLIGNIAAEADSRRFIASLEQRQISAQTEPGQQGWEIWVHDESDVDPAREQLQRFHANPLAAEFQVQPAPVKPRVIKARQNVRQFRWQRSPQRDTWLTVSLIVASIVVSLITNFGRALPEILSQLHIAEYRTLSDHIVYNGRLKEVMSGQVWRLYTPMFLHLSLLHLAFNMSFCWSVGSAIERMQGWWRLLWITLLIAPVSHVTQFFISGPMFGGMSGVLFGWFGYIWMRSVFSPEDGLHMPQSMVVNMMIWQLLCFSGLLGPIANSAHMGGLAAGVMIGAIPGLWRRFT